MADGNSKNRIMLRKILYRIDFQLIPESLHEQLFEYISSSYGEYFTDRNSETASPIDIQINAESIPMPGLNAKSQTVYVFNKPRSTECDGRILKIGRTFMFLELEINIPTMAISYYEWFADIITRLKASSAFKLTRVGLRKFNYFYILDDKKESLNKIFKIEYIPSEIEGFELDRFNDSRTYFLDKYSLNFNRVYSTGFLNNKEKGIENVKSHLIGFDFDLYSLRPEVLDPFLNDIINGLTSMNDLIYRFFCNIISDDVIAELQEGKLLKEYDIITF